MRCIESDQRDCYTEKLVRLRYSHAVMSQEIISFSNVSQPQPGRSVIFYYLFLQVVPNGNRLIIKTKYFNAQWFAFGNNVVLYCIFNEHLNGYRQDICRQAAFGNIDPDA